MASSCQSFSKRHTLKRCRLKKVGERSDTLGTLKLRPFPYDTCGKIRQAPVYTYVAVKQRNRIKFHGSTKRRGTIDVWLSYCPFRLFRPSFVRTRLYRRLLSLGCLSHPLFRPGENGTQWALSLPPPLLIKRFPPPSPHLHWPSLAAHMGNFGLKEFSIPSLTKTWPVYA